MYTIIHSSGGWLGCLALVGGYTPGKATESSRYFRLPTASCSHPHRPLAPDLRACPANSTEPAGTALASERAILVGGHRE
jgi:hypothetical protein